MIPKSTLDALENVNKKEVNDFDDELSEDNDQEDYDDFEDDNYSDDFSGAGDDTTALEKHQDLLKDLTNFNPYLKNTVNHWLGITWDEEENKFIRKSGVKPIMNIQGATWCIGRIMAYTRSNNIITNIGSQEYKYIMEDFIDEIWLNLGTRAEEFGITEEGDIQRVANELEHAAALVLMGAGDGKYNQLLAETTHRNITENITPGRPIHEQQLMRPKDSMIDKAKRAIFGKF